MKGIFKILTVSCLIFILSPLAFATNGLFSHGYSTKNKALAGAGVALPLDSLAVSINPAGMAFVGSRIDVGLSLFLPNRSFTVTGARSNQSGLAPGQVSSKMRRFLIPSLGANWELDEKNYLGISFYANGGLSTDYRTAVYPPRGSSPTGADLQQALLTPSYARKLNPKHAVGVNLILAYQSFRARGLESFSGLSRDPSKLTDNGRDHSYGIGGRIGYMGEVLPNLYLGASYQTRVFMSKLDDYAGLLAEQGDFDIPSNWTAGLAYKPIPSLAFAFDVQQILYSEVNAIANPFASSGLLGDNNGPGFGWDDMTVFKFGVQWEAKEDFALRAGYSYGEQPIPSSEVLFNILALAVPEHHLTFGLTKGISEHQEINVAVMHAFSNDVSGPNPRDPVQTIELEMDQWEVTIGYSWKF